MKVLCGNTTEFDRADYSGVSTTTTATTTVGGQHQTAASVSTVAAERCIQRSTSNRREHVLSDNG